MPDAIYKITFTMSDGSTKDIEFTAPQGPKGDTNPVYARLYTSAQFKALLQSIVSNPSTMNFIATYYNNTGVNTTIGGSTSGNVTLSPGDSILFAVSGTTLTYRLIQNGGMLSSQNMSGDITMTGSLTAKFAVIANNVDLSTLG